VLGDAGGPEEALRLTRLAADAFPPGAAPPTLWKLRAQLAAELGHAEEAAEASRRADEAPTSVESLYLDGAEHAVAGRFRKALPLLQEATRRDPQNFLAWFVQGYCHDLLFQYSDAITCYTVCIALRPDFAPGHYNRGLARLYRNDPSQPDNQRAAADFTEAVRLDAGMVDAYFDRAVARNRLKDPRGAIADLDRVLELRPGRIDAYFNRARSRRAVGDTAGAQADEAAGLRHTPEDERSLLARGSFLLGTGNAAAALGDFEVVLRRNPRSFAAIRNKAFLLAEKLNRPADAVAVLDGALEMFPDSVALRQGRAVYRARLGRRDDALADVAVCLRDDGSAQSEYKAACVHALSKPLGPEDRAAALRHLVAALRKNYDRLDLIETDHDLDALREDTDFKNVLRNARELRERSPEK
jgi:tetratricopeptide (TPR) repeat protein